MSKERRGGSRKRPPKEAKVTLRAKNVAGNLATKVVDWSAKGACLVTTDRLRPGAALELSLSGGGVRLRAKAVVRWSTTVRKDTRTAHVCGLEIREPAPKLKIDPNRRHRRFPVKELVEASCVPETWLSTLGLGRSVNASVRDLSGGGIRLSAGRALDVGERVRLRLVFRVPNTSLDAEGLVRWCRREPLSEPPRWDIGVVFKNVSDDMALQRIQKHYSSLGPSAP